MALPALAFLTSELKTTDLGLAYGIQFLIGNGFGALSKFLSGLIGDVFGIGYIFFLLSAAAFFAGIFLCFKKTMRQKVLKQKNIALDKKKGICNEK
ncbi:MAG: hypothetical protein GH144_09955 [Clostridia bacterium]|nr:hypothetical protein [Clostridia bacterium]